MNRYKPVVRSIGNQKISIILVLSISILAVVLVTGTVINIVSAANSINVQTKTNLVTSKGSSHVLSSVGGGVKVQPNQHPVASTGSPHTVPLAAHGSVKISAAHGSVKIGSWTCNVHNVQHVTCTNQQGVTKPVRYQQPGAKIGAQCYVVDLVDGSSTTLPFWVREDIDCNSEFKDMYVTPSPDGYSFKFGGKLIGCWGLEGLTGCGVMYGIDNAPIQIKVFMGQKPVHEVWDHGDITQTPRDESTFSGSIQLCDDPKYSDHNAVLTAYFHGGKVPSVHDPPYPGPYMPAQSTGVGLTLKVCNGPLPPTPTPEPQPAEAHFTNMHVQQYPSNGYQFPFSGNLEAPGGAGINNAPIHFSFRYLDDTATGGKGPGPHPFQLKYTPHQIPPPIPTSTGSSVGKILGEIAACDNAQYHDYNHDAEFNIHLDAGKYEVAGHSTPESFKNATSSNMLFHVKICPLTNTTKK
jgi:hypothetical protein